MQNKLKIFAIFLICGLFFIRGTEANLLIKGKLDTEDTNPDTIQPDNLIKLPKGDIAVIVNGSDSQYNSTAEAFIIGSLTNKGYNVVDEAKKKKIRRAIAQAQADRFAMQGNFAAILRINASYNVAATVYTNIKADMKTIENEIHAFTGTATASIWVITSNGTKLGGQKFEGKGVGYTEGEARQLAVNNAVESAMAQIF